MTKARSNATANAAKGDLTVGTGTNLSGILPVSSQNGDTIVADSSTATGLRYNPTTGNRNYVINGAFDIWARGTSGTPGVAVYTPADRWIATNSNGATVSQQSTGAPSGSRYVMRIASTGATQFCNVATMLETANVETLWGQSATVQIKLRRNASFSTSVTVSLQKSATVDAGNGATWTTISSAAIANVNLPTGTGIADWVTATFTGTVPNDGTANSLRVMVNADATFVSGAYFEIALGKWEAGSVATSFTRAGSTIQGELAACQRYYYRISGNGQNAFSSGQVDTTASALISTSFPVTMRTNPTALEQTGTATDYGVRAAGVNTTCNAIPTFQTATQFLAVTTFNTAATLTAGNGALGRAISAAYLGWSAEL